MVAAAKTTARRVSRTGAGAERPDFHKRKVALGMTRIAGAQYHEAHRLWDELRIGLELSLKADPDNEHDKNAVKIMLGEDQLGFVERNMAATVSEQLKTDMDYEAILVRKDERAAPYDQLWVQVNFFYYVKGRAE